jgi:hypothetical protein
MMIKKDEVLLDPFANSPLKILDSLPEYRRLKEEGRLGLGGEAASHLHGPEEQLIESMETVLLLYRWFFHAAPRSSVQCRCDTDGLTNL